MEGMDKDRIAKIRSLSEAEKTALICSQQYKLTEAEERIEAMKCAHESGNCVHCAEKDKTIKELNETIKALRTKIYGRSTERRGRGSSGNNGNGNKDNKEPKNRDRLPSEQYPNAKIKIEVIGEKNIPHCSECNKEMTDSGMRAVSERLEMIPMEIFIVKLERIRYHCKCCQSAPITTALPARIAPHTSLNDSVLIEAAIAKFYDLIPTERFAKMLSRSGVEISDKLLFSTQSYLAKAFYPVYELLRQEVLSSRVVHADESPHRMLERNEGNFQWYLWCFCTQNSVYFEIHNTRASSVSIDFLKDSKVEVLLTDVYSGYIRTVKEVNEYRKLNDIVLMNSAHCNEHARRNFFYSKEPIAETVLDVYGKIYSIESKVQDLIKNPKYQEPLNKENALQLRQTMDPLFEQIYELCIEILLDNAPKSSISQAANYYIKNLKGLTLFLTDLEIPIGNLCAERTLRNPAVGRKTWYGTHSRKGIETMAVHFSIFESCRVNKINPREYYNYLASLYNSGKPLITPLSYKHSIQSKPPPE